MVFVHSLFQSLPTWWAAELHFCGRVGYSGSSAPQRVCCGAVPSTPYLSPSLWLCSTVHVVPALPGVEAQKSVYFTDVREQWNPFYYWTLGQIQLHQCSHSQILNFQAHIEKIIIVVNLWYKCNKGKYSGILECEVFREKKRCKWTMSFILY